MDNTTTTDTPATGFNQANAIVFPIFAALAIVIIYMPACDFFRKRNFAMCSMIAAVTLMNLYCFINAIIWRNDDFDTWWDGQGLCDIEVNTRYQLSVVLMTSMACFIKSLADVFNQDSYSFMDSSATKRRKLIVDIFFVWGVPVFQVAIHYIATSGRYNILPIWGCADSLDYSWPFLVFYWIPNPIFCLLSGYYAIRMLIGLHQHRSNISSTLASSGSGMSTRYFVKLSIIACSLLVIWIPCESYWLYRQVPIPLHSYDWQSLHDPVSWNPILFVHSSEEPFLQYNGWASVALSVMIFSYFGFNDDATDKYRSWLVNCGLGKIWPSLKVPRTQRRRQGSTASSNISSHFDLVSKAMHYFTPSRKNSGVPSSTGPSEATHSRKGSSATVDHMSLAQITTNRNTPTPDSFGTSPLQDHDTIRSVSPLTPEPAFIRSPLPLDTISETTAAVDWSKRRNFLSSFRTHINLPFPIHSRFTPHRSSPTTQVQREHLNPIILPNIDLEAQYPRSSAHPGLRIPLPSPVSTRSTVSTNIWSDGTAIATPTSSKHIPETVGEYPSSPKMGTRAYRERERRERDLEAVMEEDRGRATEDGVVVQRIIERRESSVERV
ncbi:Pheromone a factor receptor [Lachnellula occidentalis]|uniref:Pheromone a factor receptor n=1 Tax=Lachnellula occidentalis TaxID=215460 RepID=A0A8H8UBY3_9HELO|nr:Pheromone a factor receptor [Lachnellula occidentalis]